MPTGPDRERHQPAQDTPPKPLIAIKTGHETLDRRIGGFSRLIERIKAAKRGAPAAPAERFNDRLGSQFGAAITYFHSSLLIGPDGVVCRRRLRAGLNGSALARLINRIVGSINDPTLASTLKNTVNTAIQQRTTVGLTGWRAGALFRHQLDGQPARGDPRSRAMSGSAIRRIGRKSTSNTPRLHLADRLGGRADHYAVSLTSVSGSAQAAIVNALGLGGIEWLRPALTLIALSISIFANYLLFLWIFWMLPHKPKKKRCCGTLLAAIGFEVIKFVMTMTLQVAKSPSGAAFGSVIGLMAFFYFFARLTLFCAAPDRHRRLQRRQSVAGTRTSGALKPCDRAGVIAHTGTFLYIPTKNQSIRLNNAACDPKNQHNKLPTHFSLPLLQPFPLHESPFSTFNAAENKPDKTLVF